MASDLSPNLTEGALRMLNLIQREFIVDIPLSTAWQHLAQVEHWPAWAKHIRHVELNPKGELTLNTVGSFHLANGIKSDFKMTEINQHRNWKWVGPFLWLMVHYDHKFEKVDERRTKLIWAVGAEGVGVSIFGRLFAAIYNGNLDKAIPRLTVEMNALTG
jgi:Polyketide cyclase / dehydrase and lipid transport